MSHPIAVLNYPAIDPVLVRLGPLAVHWYGMAYLAGFYFGFLAMKRMARSGRLRLSVIDLSDLLLWLIAGVMLGGRVGWWLFYHRSEGAPESWFEPIAIWHGGMSFHGGLVGVGLAMTIWAKKHRAPLLNIADCVALVAPIGLFFGRIANFINAELVGRPTSLPWGMIFPGDTLARHPSQLYEAVIEGPMLLTAIWMIARRSTGRQGRIAAAFLIFYGFGRFFIEFTRQPDSQLGFIAFGSLTMGQLLSAGLSIVGVAMWWAASREWARAGTHSFTKSPQGEPASTRLGEFD